MPEISCDGVCLVLKLASLEEIDQLKAIRAVAESLVAWLGCGCWNG